MLKIFSTEWNNLNLENIGTEKYWGNALQNYSFYEKIKPIIKRYIVGDVLDIGAGRLAWKLLLEKYAKFYVGADIKIENPELDLICNLASVLPFKGNTFNTIFCISVLEHMPEPWEAFKEFHRLIKDNGYIILSVPFIFYLHGQPYDYYRFTKESIQYLALKNGFEIIEYERIGGLFEFILNFISILCSTILYILKLKLLITTSTKFWFKISHWLSQFETEGRFVTNHIAIQRKKNKSLKSIEN
jgi:SAM-dependent methyltransferase